MGRIRFKYILYFNIVVVLWTLYNNFFIKNRLCINYPNQTYTHIVVGAGTTGCVVAAELTENPSNKVLLVEAGNQFNFLSKVPLLVALLQKSRFDWQYETISQKWSSMGFVDKKQLVPRGKGIGGSGQLNFMVHDTLEKELLNLWSSIGAYGLYDGIYEDNLETCNFKDYLSKYHQKITTVKNNKIVLTKAEEILGNIFESAIKELHIPNLIYKPSLSTVRKGERWSSFEAYLKKAAAKSNLHILCDAEVTKIIFKDKRAIGVNISKNSQVITVYADLDLVLCTGVINSPKLLLLSGIGNRTKLLDKNIENIIDLPGVGMNLHDHLNVPFYVTLEKPISFTLRKLLSFKEIANYLIKREGMFSISPVMGFGNLKSKINLIMYGMGSTNEEILRTIGNYSPKTFKSIFPYHENISQEGFVFLASCSQPKSRGYIELADTNYQTPPLIDPNYLKDDYDITCMQKAIEIAIQVLNTTSFKSVGAKLHWPHLDECKNYNISSNDYLHCLIRTTAITGYHPAGTCKMGKHSDLFSVVDNKYSVKGISGLRIVDASILPTPVETFPNSILINIAKFATKIIQETES